MKNIQSRLIGADGLQHRTIPVIDTQTGLVHGSDIRQVLSPNRNIRPDGAAINLLVIHNISLPPGIFKGNDVERFFLNTLDPSAHPYYQQLADVQVSAHFFIRRDGEIIQFVPCHERAWHAGKSYWKGREACNDFSIGIELEGTDHIPYTTDQYYALAILTAALETAYPIRERVGHSDIAPDRKTDPGESFDWTLYQQLVEQYRRQLLYSQSSESV